MKQQLLAVFIAGMVSASAFAEKPAWAGKAKPTDAQKESRQRVPESAAALDDKSAQVKKKNQPKAGESKGLEKQQAMKQQQVQKELDKGSEQGQQSRQQRKKWWKFWGDES